MKTKVVAAIAASIAFGFVTLAAGPATADSSGYTAVGQYSARNEPSDSPHFLFIGTSDDLSDKDAVLAFHIPDLDRAKPEQLLILGIFGAADWNKFVQLWRNAIAVRRTPGMDAINIGEYFDDGDRVLLGVDVIDDGVRFSVVGQDRAGGQENGLRTVDLFDLYPEQFEQFSTDVAKVTAYFGNEVPMQAPEIRQEQPAPEQGKK